MRDYATVSPLFWTGATGKAIRAMGQREQLLALYLITAPSSNMYGVYYLPLVTIAYETGSPLEGALEGLQRLSEGGFCTYDPLSEWVWVHEMARFQLADSLNKADNRVKAVNKWYEKLPKLPFLREFYDKYGAAFHIENPRENSKTDKPLGSPLEAPPKPGTGTGTGTVKTLNPSVPSDDDEAEPKKKKKKKKPAKDDPDFERLWQMRPRRVGSDRKAAAQSAFRARRKEGHTVEEIESGIARYKAFLKASGKENSEYVQMFSTFLGTNKGFLEDWTPPPPEQRRQKEFVPRDDQAAIQWGQQRGITPKVGESMWDYRQRLNQSLHTGG